MARRGGESVEKGSVSNANPMNIPPEEDGVVQEIMEVIQAVELYGDYRKMQRKECGSLVRRMKLLVPLLEEISELRLLTPPMAIPYEGLKCLGKLKKALLSGKKLLKSCNNGSKIYLAIESEMVMGRFYSVYDKINQALDGMPYNELGIADEVKEQVELLCTQLKRARKRTDTQDIVLAMDMMVVLSTRNDRNADSAVLERLANKLELQTITELKVESMAVRKLVKERNGRNAESTQQIVDLLNKFNQIAGFEEHKSLSDTAATKMLERCPSLSIPNEFLCPITLEIMTDPVIVASGQTYERESIQKWLQSNRKTCPKTRQALGHLSVAPNFALRNLILQWCEKNNFKLPKKEIHADTYSSSNKHKDEIYCLTQELYSDELDVQRKAVMKIRILSKENPDNRVMIANCGGIPPLVELLFYPDSNIQEHAVTALLNLSIDEVNKKHIARAGAIPAIIEILHNGKIEARENSAACLFSLSVLDENKVTIGCLDGIPPLVDLLQNGTVRGKKDAATALFNLSLNQENKARAIRAGIVKPVLQLLLDRNMGMADEALSILLLLASHPEGRSTIGQLSFIETLVEFIKDGTPKNKECAIAVLLELGSHDSSFILAALQFGVYEHLMEASRTGTNRGQRKANSLLHLMTKCEHIS